MAMIPQVSLFSWQDIEELCDLERLMLVVDTLPDEALVRRLEAGRGRNTYPVRARGTSVLAGVVFQHLSIESLRRGLARNAQLCVLGGFLGAAVPYIPLCNRGRLP